MEIILCLAYFTLITYLISKAKFYRLEGIHTAIIPLAFALKVICGLALTALYSHYYNDRSTADIFKYYDDSLILYQAAFSNFGDFLQMMSGIGNDNAYFDEHYYRHMNHWLRPFGSNYYNDTHILIRFNAFMRFLSSGYFSIHTIFFNFLSITGLLAFYRAFQGMKTVNNKLLLYGLLFLPSILLWGSGVLKEGVLLFGLGFLFLGLRSIKDSTNRLLWIIISIFSAYLIIRLKFYVLLALLPALIAFTIVRQLRFKKVFWWHLVTLLLLAGLGLNLGILFPELNLMEIISRKQIEFICLAEFMNSGSVIELPPVGQGTADFAYALLIGLLNSIFRPYIWEANNLLMALTALELVVVNGILFSCIIFSKKANQINFNLLWMSVSFVIVLYAIIGITTPVLGALVRYKLPALLFIILIAATLVDQKKLGIFGKIFETHHE